MSASNDAEYRLLVTWIKGITGLTVIRADAMPAAKRPSGQYVSVKIFSTRNQNQQIIKNNKECIKQQTIFSVSINIFRGNAMDIARLISASLLSELITYTYFKNYGFVQVSDIRDITTQIKSEHEERANFDIELFNCTKLSIGIVDPIKLKVNVCQEKGQGKLTSY